MQIMAVYNCFCCLNPPKWPLISWVSLPATNSGCLRWKVCGNLCRTHGVDLSTFQHRIRNVPLEIDIIDIYLQYFNCVGQLTVKLYYYLYDLVCVLNLSLYFYILYNMYTVCVYIYTHTVHIYIYIRTGTYIQGVCQCREFPPSCRWLDLSQVLANSTLGKMVRLAVG